ncbi:MAG: hypothetical protein CM1200mP23_2150 [Nitrososphaerota archaeon]|nr:MAG: hypothetical protein CM1200mP23_2150 [Nitrososphaerota archaeon]
MGSQFLLSLRYIEKKIFEFIIRNRNKKKYMMHRTRMEVIGNILTTTRDYADNDECTGITHLIRK